MGEEAVVATIEPSMEIAVVATMVIEEIKKIIIKKIQ